VAENTNQSAWEALCKVQQQISYIRKSALQAIWDTTNGNMSPEEKIDKIRDIAKIAGVYTRDLDESHV
jgi:hypothetical protein